MSDVLSEERLEEIRERANRAADHVGRLCTKEDRWTMSVPARDTDSDVLLMEVAETDVPDLLAEVKRLRDGIEDARNYCSRSMFCVVTETTEGES